jgi:hypothetical protein
MNLDNDDTADFGEELRQNRSEVEQEEDVLYLSLFHGAGKLGGAYYNLTDGILYVMDDMADPAPHFKLVLTVTAQLNPKRLLICSRHNEAFAKAAKDQMTEVTADESSLATETRYLERIVIRISNFLSLFIHKIVFTSMRRVSVCFFGRN